MDELGFEPRLGRIRSRGSAGGRKYLHAVLTAVARRGFSGRRKATGFSGERIARGSVTGRMLGSRGQLTRLRTRRAIVKTQLVHLRETEVAAARAHLRYIERDGTARNGERGRLYSAGQDGVDGKSFVGRCAGDRHQFRLIVSVEDGDQYDDLKPLIRRFMSRMEQDLGTRLDWVAADHLDTLHPHTHIVLRGKDERGENLVIAPAYIKYGMRERIAELVSIDLGPRTDVEVRQRLYSEIGAERFTSVDRRLLQRMEADFVVSAGGTDMFEHAIRTGRLRKLEALGLAEPLGRGKWQLSERLEVTLRSLGERGDIVRIMQRALKAADLQRGPAEQVVGAPASGAPVTGRLVSRGLCHRSTDRHYLIVDGVDGCSRFIDIGKGELTEPLPDAAIVRITAKSAAVPAIDKRIAAFAAEHHGRYSIDLHLAVARDSSREFALAHVRRLEAIRRRTAAIERFEDGSWAIPPNFLEVAARYEAAQLRQKPVQLEILSPIPLERLAAHDGATWLDHELASPRSLIRDAGFGREVRSALALRRAWLLDQDLATVRGEQVLFPADLLTILRQRELVRAARAIELETGLGFAPAEAGSTIEGIFRRRLDLASGRVAVIANAHEFTLVPWRLVLERARGRSVSGVVRRDGAVSWSLDREPE